MSESVIINRLVIPPKEAEKLVAEAGTVYLRDCPCRTLMQVCPLEKWKVCMLFEHASPEDRKEADSISAEEAVEIIKMTTERGDIHQVFYFDEGSRPFELCNCCDCCCYPLREAKERGDYTEQLHSNYVAVTDKDLCVGCGLCLDSCYFEARQLENDILQLIDIRCFGCGCCIPNCPEAAIRLEFQQGRGVTIPTL
jgi:ferredoxin